jgi:capsular exopolysaccharide synthesis family protein
MNIEKDIFGENANKALSLRETLVKYLANYPLFIFSIILCVGLGLLYTRYATPKYRATTLILIKKNLQGDQKDWVSQALTGKSQSGLDNEVVLLHSTSLIERVVAKKGLNISYYYLGKIRKTELYTESPFRLIPQEIKDSSTSISLTVKDLNYEGGVIQYGAEGAITTSHFFWNRPFSLGGKKIVISPKSSKFNPEKEYLVTWRSVEQTAEEIANNLFVKELSDASSIIQLEITTENLQRGKEILDALVQEYNVADIEDRNIISQNTIRFIDDRLSLISGQLNGVEGNLENFRGENQIIDIPIQSSQSFGNLNEASQNIKAVSIKQKVVQMLHGYFNNPNTFDKLVPSTLGLDDPTLSSLISRYNELQADKQKQAPFETKNSIVMRDLNNQINDIRGSVLEALENLTKNLQLQENNLQQQNGQYRQFLASLPGKERAMQEIKRKQSITEGLYLYLLQKREEVAMTSTSANVVNFKQVDHAKGYGPVEPNKNIILYTLILGMLLPIGFIYLKDALDDKINSRNDITKKVTLPIIGEIAHIPKAQARKLAAMDRSIAGEQFRMIRTNASLLNQKKDKQTILVTSSSPGEGKSLVSMNLAGVLAVTGRKVALLEFDLRKPSIIKNFQISKNTRGISNYLNGEVETLSDIVVIVGDIPSLHLFPSGNETMYAADLLVNNKLKDLFRELQQDYDYIVIDSSPVSLVSDAFILGGYSDTVIYVLRQRYTLKKQLNFLNDIISAAKLKNLCIVLNDVKTGGKFNYYGYGYENEKKAYYGSDNINGKKTSLWKRTGVVKV